MCCLFCAELEKEKLNAKEVQKLFLELMTSEDKEHLSNYEKILENTSEQYQEKLYEESTNGLNDKVSIDVNDDDDWC